MTISRTSAIMSDIPVLEDEYIRTREENNALVRKIQKLDVRNRCLERTVEEQINEIATLNIELARIKQIVERIAPELLEQ